MVARVQANAWLLAALALAGCSGGGGDGGDDAASAVETLDVQATQDTGIIRGVVVDTTITPVANVSIALRGPDQLARNGTSNDAGAFGFEGLPPGDYYLNVGKEGYTSIQASTTVVAGDNEPDLLKVQLTALPRGDPYVDVQQRSLFMDSSTAVMGSSLTLGGFTGQGSYGLAIDLLPNATVTQVEMRWESTTAAGENLNAYGGTYLGGTDSEDRVHYRSITSGVPLVGRFNATDGNRSADRLSMVIRADPTVPASVFVNQGVEVYVHTFYNVRPRDDWQFGRDGDYPL